MFYLADLRYALRLLAKTPRFTLTTIAVLAGGLAISIYTFAVLDTMLYKALPIADGDAAVRIIGEQEGRDVPVGSFELSEVRDGLATLKDFGVYQSGRAVLTEDDATRSVKSTATEYGLFRFAGVQPLFGRTLQPQDSVPGAEPVAVIGYKTWRSAFQGDRDVVDRQVRINGKPTRIVGVMPKGFMFPVSAEMWTPLSTTELRPTHYVPQSFGAFAHLADGATRPQADAELQAALRMVQQQFPRPQGDDGALDGIHVDTFQAAQTGPEGAFVFAILNIVSVFILLLACVNVGNMLLARTNERMKEIAIRVALGAPQGRLLFQMMLESVVICVVGGVVALALAGWALGATNQFLASTFEGDLPFWWNWGLDSGSVLATVGFVALAVLLVSVLPTYGAIRMDSSTLLRDGTRGAQGRTTGRISRSLVTAEIVLISVIMVVGSASTVLAYRAAHVDFGMDTTSLLTMPVELDGEAYDQPDEQLRFYDRLLAVVRANPELDGAIVSQELGQVRFGIDGAVYAREKDYPEATLLVASDTPRPIGTTLVEGRFFDGRDTATGLHTALVSKILADAYWPGTSALGRRIRVMNDDGTPDARTIVGVVSDVRRGDLFSTSKDSFNSVYVPLAQNAVPEASIVVRYRGRIEDARSALYRSVGAIDPYLAPSRIMSYEDVLEQLTLMATTMTTLFVRCGIFAVLLAMTGIYGLSANAVIRRTHEIGLRRAVGARDWDIVALFLREGGRQLAWGLGVSTLLSAAVLYAIARFAGVGGGLLTLIGMAVALGVSALVLVAIYISARRAVEHEPAVALRFD